MSNVRDMATTQARAWTFTTGGYPLSMRLSTITPPSTSDLEPKSVLVKVHAAGLNPVDVQLMNLKILNLMVTSGEKGIGIDFSGTVIAGGKDSGFQAGDEVYGIHPNSSVPSGGSLAEVIHVNVDKSAMVKKPSNLSFVHAAGLGCVFLTARTCIESVVPYVELTQSKRVAVLGGSSSTGMYTVHLAKQRGWKVISTCSGRNADFVANTMGADEIVDYTQKSVPEEIRRFKPDAIIDCVGGVECHGIAKRYVTIVGDKTSRDAMGGPMTYYWTPYLWVRWALGRLGLAEVYDNVILDVNSSWLEESKKLPSDKLVTDSVFPFEDAKKAFERLNTGRARGKVIVEVSK